MAWHGVACTHVIVATDTAIAGAATVNHQPRFINKWENQFEKEQQQQQTLAFQQNERNISNNKYYYNYIRQNCKNGFDQKFNINSFAYDASATGSK